VTDAIRNSPRKVNGRESYCANLPYSYSDFCQCDRTRRHSTAGQRHRSARELADAELQRAIQLSLQEMNGPNGQAQPGYVPYQPSPSRWGYSEPPLVDRNMYPVTQSISEEEDPDLRAAIEASLREANAPKPSVPIEIEPGLDERQYPAIGSGYSQSNPEISQNAVPKVPNYDLAPLEADAILTFNQTVEQVQAQGGRDLSRYPAVTELYDKASGLRPKLALSMDDTGRKEREWHFHLANDFKC
jgi:hepatocyte growth factor-regulated tyrosine kinase substrate